MQQHNPMEKKTPNFAERTAEMRALAEHLKNAAAFLAEEAERMQQAHARFEARKAPKPAKR